MLYDIRHATTYHYAAAAPTARCVLRLTPLDRRGQRRLRSHVEMRPAPRSMSREVDFFGNAYAVALFDTPHRELVVEATSRVEVSRPARAPAAPAAWESVAAAAAASLSLGPDSPVHYIYPSPLVALHPQVTAYARESLAPGRDVAAGALELARRIRADFAYRPEATDVTTPLAEAFAARRGVCQDFAHIMIAGLRGLGAPARYVSGYIRTIPPEGKPRLEGADATHAWVDVWCGPETGWAGFDPTNAMEAGNDHIELAIGRDFSDVSPIYGVVLGSGEQDLDVEVDVIPVAP
ncbi:MAG: transglutaminase family protein [Methylobacteriaceae bacterium]|nr:transglutaminase family protein [Methylobacteriaceae bacterium]